MKVDVSEMTIREMLEALDRGSVSSVDLVCAYLNRIAYYDRTGICLNSAPVLNPEVLTEAAESDRRRRSGQQLGMLEGIPFTVKDSFKVAGMTVASGSPAFEHLVANTDAATVAQLRAAGGVLLGKTNMPPMAAGGVQPGAYGYAKSPYHPGYLTAAYGSGSSNGAGTATAASLCAFGMAEETLSSGRSPASNNGLVAYTPSRGLISIRGNWPLFPTCDVVVPYARSIDDLLRLLDVLIVEDPEVAGDFWRSQRIIDLPKVNSVRPPSFLHARREDLAGLRLGVPRMFIGEDPHKANPVAIRGSVKSLWDRVAVDLARLGAEVIPVDFPVVSNYEVDRPEARSLVERGLVHKDWEATEMGPVIARSWQEFLEDNDMDRLCNLADVDGDRVFPQAPERVYANAGTAFDYARLVELAKAGLPAWEDLPGFKQSLRGLEEARQQDFEEWMKRLGLDAVVFPANGDVASADLFERPEHMDDALRNGVLFSNGNRAIRHLGIPTVTVPMGKMADISMPVGLTIAGPAYADDLLLDIAYTYEKRSQHRPRPPRTPAIPASTVEVSSVPQERADPPENGLSIDVHTNMVASEDGCTADVVINIEGVDGRGPCTSAWLDGRTLNVSQNGSDSWIASGNISSALAHLDDMAMLVVNVRLADGVSLAHWELIKLPSRSFLESALIPQRG